MMNLNVAGLVLLQHDTLDSEENIEVLAMQGLPCLATHFYRGIQSPLEQQTQWRLIVEHFSHRD